MSTSGPFAPSVYAGLIDDLGEAERLALAYAPRAVRAPLVAAFAFDAALRRAALAKSEALMAQVRLAWWREACARLPNARDHPVLEALGETWREGPEALIALVDTWEAVAVTEADFIVAAEGVADARADVVARSVGELRAAAIEGAARCWTLATLSAHAPDAQIRDAMIAQVRAIPPARLPGTLRPLAVLGGLSHRAAIRGGALLLGDRLSPLAAMRLGILGR